MIKQQRNDMNNPTLDAKYKRFIERFRNEHIPKQYNQVMLLDELNNPEIDHFFSISNRTDGKSINYVHALLNVAIEFDLGLMFIVRNWTIRPSFQELIDEVIDISDVLNREDFTYIRSQHYIRIDYKKQTIGVIVDLNNAQDLKQYSNFLKKFPILIYDEFLVLTDSYVSDEWQKLKTIYESIDRVAEYPLIRKPKIFYLGNAVNFESPILHGLKMFNILENHPLNTAKIYKYEFNIMLEINRNENQNKLRNTRAFGGTDDAMTTAKFDSNDYNIATDADRNHVRMNPRNIYVKLRENYLKIWFNRDSLMIILSIESFIDEPYQFNMLLKDNRKDSIYLNESYFDERHIKKIDKGLYLFENNFSKNFITNDFNDLNHLRINKLIRLFLQNEQDDDELVSKEKQFEENYIEQTKKALLKKIWD